MHFQSYFRKLRFVFFQRLMTYITNVENRFSNIRIANNIVIQFFDKRKYIHFLQLCCKNVCLDTIFSETLWMKTRQYFGMEEERERRSKRGKMNAGTFCRQQGNDIVCTVFNQLGCWDVFIYKKYISISGMIAQW